MFNFDEKSTFFIKLAILQILEVVMGCNDMSKYFGYKYLVNWPEIIEVYENPLGHFYCLLHTVCVNT